MAWKTYKVRVRKKKRVISRQKSIIHSVGYRRGCTNGFQRGREAGFEQGRNEAVVQKQILNALVIIPAVIPSLEIGILQPFEELKRQGSFHYEVRTEGEVTKELIAEANTIIFQRNVEPEAYQYLEWAHQMGKQTIYVIDDNFLEISPTTAIGAYYADSTRRETFIKFLKNANTIKVDAPFFGDHIRQYFNSNVVYFPASVDFAWVKQAGKPEREDGQIVIGYEGGHKEEAFAQVVPALLKILKYYGGFVRLEFIGFIPADLIGHPSVTYIEGNSDYKAFMKQFFQCTWDIGLAPLEDNLFNNCKTNNKFREYSACWIPGIYSSSPVYTDYVTHDETGFLVPHSTEGWYQGIKQMIDNPTMRQRIRGNAGTLARQHFTMEECAERWKKQLLNL